MDALFLAPTVRRVFCILAVALTILNHVSPAQQNPCKGYFANNGTMFAFNLKSGGCTFHYQISASRPNRVTFYRILKKNLCDNSDPELGIAVGDGGLESFFEDTCHALLAVPDPLFLPYLQPPAHRKDVPTPDANGQASQQFLAIDLNGDGNLDYIFLTPRGVTIQLTKSDNSLASTVQYSLGFSPDLDNSTIAAGDFNGDGKLDLAISNPGLGQFDPGGLVLLLGNGDGTFQSPESVASPPNPGSLAVADFDGDGSLDLAVASFSSPAVAILTGKGDGTFNPAFSIPTGGDSQGVVSSILAVDLNADGQPDLVVANRAYPSSSKGSSLSVLLNSGGRFQPPAVIPLAAPLRPDYLAYADLNNDGITDLLAVSQSASAMIVLIGNSDGTFQSPAAYATGNSPASIATAKLQDGNSLIVTPDQASGNLWFSVVSPDGVVGAPPYYLLGGATGIAIGDLDGDGLADAVVAGQNGLTVQLTTNSQLQTPVTYPVRASQVAIGDMNGDGRPDIVANGSTVLLGNGDGTFQTPIVTQLTLSAQGFALADFNHDGKLDVVAAGAARSAPDSNSAIVVLTGNGDGTFQPPINLPVSGVPEAVAVGDLNGDGIPDIAAVTVTGFNTTGLGKTALLVFLGNGDGTFQPANTLPLKLDGGTNSALVIADFNNDGKPDIALSSNNDDSTIYILFGDGAGNFQQAPKLPVSREDFPVYLSAADIDGDGNLDLIAAHSFGQLDATYFLGNGDGTFQAEQQLPSGNSPAAVAVDQAERYTTIVSAGATGVSSVAVPHSPVSRSVSGRSASGIIR
jgi:hypothetical protein